MLAFLVLIFLQSAQAICPSRLADRVTVTAVDETTVNTPSTTYYSGDIPLVAVRVTTVTGCNKVMISGVDVQIDEWVDDGSSFQFVPDTDMILYRGVASAAEVGEMTSGLWGGDFVADTRWEEFSYSGSVASTGTPVTISAAVPGDTLMDLIAGFWWMTSVSATLTGTIESITITSEGVSATVPVEISNTWSWDND